MAKVLYYYDDRVIRDAGGMKLIKPTENENEYKILTALESTTIDLIVDMISYVTAAGELSTLRILAHGRPGKTLLGKDGISELTVDRFKKIKDRFASDGKIELHSCLVAQYCTSGVHCTLGGWLQKLADYTGATVTAAQIKQQADSKWAWEGMTSTFKPWKPGDDIGLGAYPYGKK